jgi:lipopolysaccharide export system permease protein
MRLKFTQKEIFELDTEYATRPALALGCLFFVLIGCPVAIWFHKRDYLSAFVTCFLPIVVIYYPLMMFGINLGKEGRVDPAYMMWTGNVVLGVAGLFLTWRLARR